MWKFVRGFCGALIVLALAMMTVQASAAVDNLLSFWKAFREAPLWAQSGVGVALVVAALPESLALGWKRKLSDRPAEKAAARPPSPVQTAGISTDGCNDWKISNTVIAGADKAIDAKGSNRFTIDKLVHIAPASKEKEN